MKPNPKVDDVRYFEISPNFISALNFATASYKTTEGIVSVKWQRDENGDVDMLVEAPIGTYGKVILPPKYNYDGKTEFVWNESCGMRLKLCGIKK